MSKYTSNYRRICKRIHKLYRAETEEEKKIVVDDIFSNVIQIMELGTIEIIDAFATFNAGAIGITEISIEGDDYLVMVVEPKFIAACEDYKLERIRAGRRLDYITRFDDYDTPCALLNPENTDLDVDFTDPRGGAVYLMTEEKLRHELKTRPYKWLLYRTPYRPGSNAEYDGQTPTGRIE